MNHSYTEYDFKVKPKTPATEILIAELAEIGFEAFFETETGVLAYIPTDQDQDNLLEEVDIMNSIVFKISFQKKIIEQKNWNEEWEKDFQPIEVSDKCRIRASFHPKKEVEFDIIINPKMSFGTGHHATTYLMLEYILEEDLTHKQILDMGCGTGVLAILASLKNAKHIDAIDIDSWSYQNAIENAELNNCKNIEVFEGDASLLKNKKYDYIFANINIKVLLDDLNIYADCLSENGVLFISGFFETDLPDLKEKAKENGLTFDHYKTKDQWTAARLLKI